MKDLRLQGVVFDVDGTLFDTERLSRSSWRAVGEEMGWPQVADHYLEFVGRSRADILQRMLELFGPEFPREEYMSRCGRRSQERMEREGVPLKGGVREILELLNGHGLPLALATSTYRQRTLRRLELTGLGGYFKAVITGDQVARSKPDPEIYLLACRALGTAPERTLAVEDSRNGVLSASAAGMPAVMIPDLIPPTPELEGHIHTKCASLLELRDILAQAL